MKIFLIIMLSTLLSSCSSGSLIAGDLDREGQWLKVKVKRISPDLWAKSHGRLEADKNGESIYYLNDPTNECVIHIISRGRGMVDGVYTLTLGHELMHCLYGDYHD